LLDWPQRDIIYTNFDIDENTLVTIIILAKDVIASPITITDEIRARKLDQQFENTADPINGTHVGFGPLRNKHHRM
jgi:hypothetical protein